MNRLVINFVICIACTFATLANGASGQKQVLFVCTGNFYRSRFAEALFNQKARADHLNWHANSRGLNLVPWQFGISHFAKDELVKRGVPKELWSGTPKRLTKNDIKQSDYIILMDEAEHRRPFEKKFHQTPGAKVQYWHIPDTGQMNPAQACAKMSIRVNQLLETLESDSK